MQNDINFLRSADNKQTKLSTSVKIMRIFAFACIIFVPASAIVLGLLISFSPLAGLQKTENDLITLSRTEQAKAGQVQFIVDRISKASDFMAKQDKYDEVVKTILSKSELTPDLSVTGMSVSSNLLSLQISAPSLQSLQSFEDTMANMKDDNLSGLIFQQLGYDAAGNTYTQSVTMQVK